MVTAIPGKTSILRSSSGRSHAMLPAPRVGMHCVTPARAAAKETKRELNQSLAIITNFHTVNRPIFLWKSQQPIWCILSEIIIKKSRYHKKFSKVVKCSNELNHWQCLQTKLERNSNKSVLFGKFCVKLLATFTSKTRKHNFRKVCLCLLPLVAFHSQGKLFPSLFPPATSNLKQKARTATENETKVVRWRNPRRSRSRRFCHKTTYSASLHFILPKRTG